MEALFEMQNAAPQDDRTLLTCFLTRDELALLFEGVRCRRIKATRVQLAACMERRRAAERRTQKNTPAQKAGALPQRMKKV